MSHYANFSGGIENLWSQGINSLIKLLATWFNTLWSTGCFPRSLTTYQNSNSLDIKPSDWRLRDSNAVIYYLLIILITSLDYLHFGGFTATPDRYKVSSLFQSLFLCRVLNEYTMIRKVIIDLLSFAFW